MTVEVIHNAGAEPSVAAVFQNGGVANGGLIANPSNKKSKEKDSRRRRRKQKKKSKISSSSLGKEDGNDSDVNGAEGDVTSGDSAPNQLQVVEQVEVKYVPEKVELDDDLLLDFKNVFEMFSFKELEGVEGGDKKDETDQDAAGKKMADSDSDEEEQDNQQKEKGISNKKKKLQRRMKISELKQICRRSDVVEISDATASDPKLLVFLKSYRNTVAVPRHWCQKRKYLQIKLREMKPGILSKELKEALGMPEGAPPPWLINMQRYGPPPSYPHLKIPWLNAPIPPGASFGYHPGGWGKPPVDEFGRPLYGDVFGAQQQEQPNYEEEPVDKSKHWGDLEEEDEEEEEEDEEEEDEEQTEEEELGDGFQSIDSLSSTPTVVETPDVIDLRNQQRKEPEKPLYQVLEEKEEMIAPGTLLGTTHTYVVRAATQDKDKAGAKRVDPLRGQKTDKVDVSLQPEELEAMDNVLTAKYEEAREEERLRTQREDFSDMVVVL